MATIDALKPVENLEEPHKPAGPCVVVICGAAGDLTSRKLIPSLYNLSKANLLPAEFAVLGFSRDDLPEDKFRQEVTRFLPTEERGTAAYQTFTERLFYQCGDFSDQTAFGRLSDRLAQLDKDHSTQGNYLFYLATAPMF